MTTAAAFVLLAAAGAVARWRSAHALDQPYGWPLGTLLVNLAGALCLGVLIGSGADDAVRTAVGTGGIGALTTWSGFAAHLGNPERRLRLRAAYAAATLVGSVAAAWCGLAMAD